MKRVVILGRGGAGKSTVAVKLSKLADAPVIELDKHFWQPGLVPTPPDEWKKIQQTLISEDKWIIDGDLGKYDILEPRLKAADTVIVLDFSFIRCFMQARKRSSERFDFWWWVFTWRWASRPKVIRAIRTYAKQADAHILRSPKALEKFLEGLA
jgi:adenylate kinase family enzyme